MQNGNHLIACSNGIYIFDSNLKENLNFIQFNTTISTEKEAELITISQYTNNEYIIVITKNKFYLLSSEGQLIFDYDINKDNEGQTEDYFTLVPYKYENNYNFIVGFINTNKFIDIIYYKINFSQKKLEIIRNYEAEIKNQYDYRLKFNYGFDCHIMHSISLGDLLTCFHFDSNPAKIGILSLYLNSDIEKNEDYYETYSLDIGAKLLKAITSPDKSKALIVFVDMNRYVYYMFYDINLKEFTTQEKYVYYNIDYPSCIQAQYFSQTHEYILSFSDKKNFKIVKFDENMNIILNEDNDYNLDSSNYRISFYNIALTPESKSYALLMDSNYNSNKTTRFSNLPDIFSPEEIFPISFNSSESESIPNIFSSIITTNLQSKQYSIIISSMISTTYSEIKSTIPSTIITNIPIIFSNSFIL